MRKKKASLAEGKLQIGTMSPGAAVQRSAWRELPQVRRSFMEFGDVRCAPRAGDRWLGPGHAPA
jgi:hypothetical protein